jgi:hypothetical protein
MLPLASLLRLIIMRAAAAEQERPRLEKPNKNLQLPPNELLEWIARAAEKANMPPTEKDTMQPTPLGVPPPANV